MLSGSEASKRAPNHTPAKLPNTPPQQSRSAPAGREFRFFAALRMTGWGRASVTPQCPALSRMHRYAPQRVAQRAASQVEFPLDEQAGLVLIGIPPGPVFLAGFSRP